MDFKKKFQAISYLQYPLMLLALFFSFKPYFNGIEYMASNLKEVAKDYNYVLIFIGLGIAFSTLQDTTKTQNKFSKKIWENPKKGKIAIILITCMTFFTLIIGVFGYFISNNEIIKELSFGTIVMGIGLIGFLKTALEVFENHRKDKNYYKY
ncbi:MAG: hypothetical protein L3J14_02660 [Flavobacteriaceae bacterium]|nr:hypothetical protein [Flavobacteriaceae bacterium]